MSSNPYETRAATQTTAPTKPTNWMIVVGVGALLLAFFCLVASILSMVGAFQLLSEPNTKIQPSHLAAHIYTALMYSIPAVPLKVIGIVFIILGYVRRQPL